LSVQQAQDVLYCTTGDVERYFQKATFDQSSDPTASEVQKFIGKWSARFDRRTGRAFRPNQVVDETHDHRTLYYWLSGHPIRLLKRNIITPLDSAKGDKLEVWTGNKWEDWVSSNTYNEGRDQDYWVDNPIGVLFIFERAILRPHPKFRVTYRYGEKEDPNNAGDPNYIPADVRDAVAARTAADLIRSDIYGTTVPGSSKGDNSDPNNAAEQWVEEFDKTVRDWHKVEFV
jgi:hypothetical protein